MMASSAVMPTEELHPQEPAARVAPAPQQSGTDRGPDAEEQEIQHEHVGEAVRVRAHLGVDHAEEQLLEAERDRAGEPVDREPGPDPFAAPAARSTGHRADDRGGGRRAVAASTVCRSRRRCLHGAIREIDQQRRDHVERARDTGGRLEAVRAEQVPTGHRRAGAGADGVDAVHAPDQRTGVGDARRDRPRDQGQRQPHQRRRHQQDRGVETERRERARKVRYELAVEVVEEQQAYPREHADAHVGEREQRERTPRAEAVGQPAAEEAAEAQSGEKCRHHGGRRGQIDARMQRDDSLPHDLQRQRREPGEREDRPQYYRQPVAHPGVSSASRQPGQESSVGSVGDT